MNLKLSLNKFRLQYFSRYFSLIDYSEDIKYNRLTLILALCIESRDNFDTHITGHLQKIYINEGLLQKC